MLRGDLKGYSAALLHGNVNSIPSFCQCSHQPGLQEHDETSVQQSTCMAQLSARSAIREEQEYESKLLVIPEASRGDGAFKGGCYLPSVHSQLYKLHAVSHH